MSAEREDLSRLALVFHKHNVEFVLIGARAAAFYGHARATEDYDFLIQDSERNIQSCIEALRELYPHIELDLTPADFYKSIVVKILDDPELDVSIQAWTLNYEDTRVDQQQVVIDGVNIPYLGIDSLIQSKLTMREQDKWDVQVLQEIKRSKAGPTG
ncbi:MAG: nucleotidyl transferase AbiEii/AbiGii toxin family protein [Leptospiraceae bacterium]|nr:nucleotidyl transferase AbiEii/AbiGii toxin family protein [Leptospiraceae bacterium]